MDKEQAYKIGLAFKLGMIYAKGKAHARKLTTDKAEWITVHPNGKENKGRPALIDSTTGQVLGGMGGKFNGQHISIANSKSNKPALLNNQKMGFYDVEREQDKTTSQLSEQSIKANLNQNEIMFNSLVRNFGNGGDVDLNYWLENIDTETPDVKKIVTPKEVYERKDGKWINSKGEQLYTAQMENQIYNDFKEFRKSSDYGSDEHANKVDNDYLLSRGKDLDPKTVEKIEKKKEQREKLLNELSKSNDRTHSQYMGNVTRRNKVDKLDKEIKDLETKLRDKGAEERANTNKKPAENTLKAMTEQEYLDSKGVGGAFSDYMLDKVRSNPNVTERSKKRFRKEADQARNDYFDKREQARKEYQEKISNGELRNKTPLEQRLEKAQGHEDNASVQASRRLLEKQGIDWRTGKALNAKGEETLRKYNQTVNNQPAENQIANTTNTYINNIQNEINKAKGNNETLSKLKTHVTVRKALENLPDGSIIHSQKGGFLRKEKDGSFSALNDQGELVSKNMPLKIDDLYDSSNNWSIGIGKTTEEAQKNTTTFRLDNTADIGNSKRVEEQKQQARQDYFKKYENSFKDSDGHTTAGLNDIDFDRAVKAFNNSSQDPERRARVLRQDYVSSVNNMYDDLKGRIENKEQQEYLNKEFEKGKQQILKAYNDYLSSESQTASTSVVGKMRSALQARKMNEKQDRAFEKRANIAGIVERIQERIGDGLWERNNKNLERRNNNNNYLSNVLNKPITNWNGKIYNYKNGDKAVFINKEKIVLNAEQYKKLKELAGK